MPKSKQVIFQQISQSQAERYAKETKSFLPITSGSDLNKVVKQLELLYKKYSKAKDYDGLTHTVLSAEEAINHARNEGFQEAVEAISEWLKCKEK